jgi:hypothetical protein
MMMERFSQLYDSTTPKQRKLAVAVAGAALFLLLCGFVLSPYFSYYLSLRGELSSWENLVKSKVARAAPLENKKSERDDYLKELKKIDLRFFNESEAQEFMRKLPRTAADFGGRIVSLKPEIQEDQMSRSESLIRSIGGLKISNERAVIDLIKNGRRSIDLMETENSNKVMREVLALLPQKEKENFRNIWQQVFGEAGVDLRMKKIRIDLRLQWRGASVSRLLDWLYGSQKLVEIENVGIALIPDREPEVEAEVSLLLNVIKN